MKDEIKMINSNMSDKGQDKNMDKIKNPMIMKK